MSPRLRRTCSLFEGLLGAVESGAPHWTGRQLESVMIAYGRRSRTVDPAQRSQGHQSGRLGLRAAHSDGGSAAQLTHTDEATGKASMVDVSGKIMDKGHTMRSATARGKVWLNSGAAYRLVRENVTNKKGDVLSVSQLAGIMGAKQTSNLIPLCHPLLLSHVDTRLSLNDQDEAVVIEATVKTVGPTGVEMEALTAVSVAALTVYDMCKAASKRIRISDIFLVEKLGGKSGHWRYDGAKD